MSQFDTNEDGKVYLADLENELRPKLVFYDIPPPTSFTGVSEKEAKDTTSTTTKKLNRLKTTIA